MNLSIATDTFCSCFRDKWTKEVSNREEINNYRPIPVLRIGVSKIHEKTCTKLAIKITSREQFAILELQPAFRSGHSTEMALIRITDEFF